MFLKFVVVVVVCCGCIVEWLLLPWWRELYCLCKVLILK